MLISLALRTNQNHPKHVKVWTKLSILIYCLKCYRCQSWLQKWEKERNRTRHRQSSRRKKSCCLILRQDALTVNTPTFGNLMLLLLLLLLAHVVCQSKTAPSKAQCALELAALLGFGLFIIERAQVRPNAFEVGRFFAWWGQQQQQTHIFCRTFFFVFFSLHPFDFFARIFLRAHCVCVCVCSFVRSIRFLCLHIQPFLSLSLSLISIIIMRIDKEATSTSSNSKLCMRIYIFGAKHESKGNSWKNELT